MTTQVIPVRVRRTNRVSHDGTKHLYTCYDGIDTIFKYARNYDEAKEKFSEALNVIENYQLDFVEPQYSQLFEDDILLIRNKHFFEGI
jgi:hypothetical protein